ncbi:MAG: hypothetical protein AABZ18_03070, partial [Pseudomonadota bacterium]
ALYCVTEILHWDTCFSPICINVPGGNPDLSATLLKTVLSVSGCGWRDEEKVKSILDQPGINDQDAYSKNFIGSLGK